ncbi:MAG: glycosyltransferase family 4 protein [Cyclobacteriaceae bacterium]
MAKLKLLFDAKWLFEGHVSGKEVVQNQLKYLIRQNEFELFVLLRKSDKERVFKYPLTGVKLIYIASRVNALSNSFLVDGIIRKNKIDIILFHNHIPYFNRNCFRVCFIHDVLFLDFPEFFSYKERLYFKLIVESIKRSDHVITISNSEKNRILKWKLKKSNEITVTHNGINDSFLTFRADKKERQRVKEKYDLPDRFVLYLGRLNFRKNIGGLIEAMKFVDVPLMIGGSPSHKMENITSIESNSEIRFLGFIDTEDLPYLYNLSTVFCFPSFAEGFGLPPIEAMATGTPTAVSNTTCFPEVCENASVFFDPKDSSSIAKAINDLLENDSLRDDRIQKGSERSKEFTWESSIERLTEQLKLKYNEFESFNNRI